jgi:ArsR family transcriptional regulator
MTQKILFICRGNSARSQLAEAIINRDYSAQYHAVSAGSHPNKVDPRTLETLSRHGYSTDNLRSKAITEFAAEQFDYVITLCSAANQECGVFENTEESLFWDLPAPSTHDGALFEGALSDLQKRISLFSMVHAAPQESHFDPQVLHKCLSDQTRLMITMALYSEIELSVGELCDALQESQPKISRALAVLRNCGIVVDRRKGQWAFYSISPSLPQWATETLKQTLISVAPQIKAASQWLHQHTHRPSRHV